MSAICQRTGSDWPEGRAGWRHVLGKTVPVPLASPTSTSDPVDWPDLTSQCVRALGYVGRNELAADLGVSERALEAVQAGWHVGSQAVSFPMRNGQGEIVGIRLRTASKKFSVPGSNGHGLFIPDQFHGEGPLMVVEGPTDTAAMLDLGFDAIGRPFNQGGGDFLVEWLTSHPRDMVVIWGENDGAKTRPDGSQFFPGVEGAEALCTKVVGSFPFLPVRMLFPPQAKDIREWKRLGAKENSVWRLVRNGSNWRPGA